MAEVLDVDGYAIGAKNTMPHAIMPLQRFVSRWRLIACMQVIDFAIFFSVGVLWFHTLAHDTAYSWWPLYLFVALLAAATIHCVFQCFRLYEFGVLSRGRDAAVRAFLAGLISFGPFLAPRLIQPGTSAEAGCCLVAAALAGIALLRMSVARLATALQQSGVVGRRIYIIAENTGAAVSLSSRIESLRENHVVGTWSLAHHAGPIETALEGAMDFLRHNPVDDVILTLPLSQSDRIVQAGRVLRCLPRPVLLAPTLDSGDNIVLHLGGQGAGDLDGLGNMVLVKLSDRPLAGWRWVMKDVQDRSLALVLLGIVAPVMLAVIITIKISDPGPAFFRQKRLGYDAGTFNIIKFRTMRVAATTQDSQTLELTSRDDPRVFPVGRILRKTSLDELPQLLNVLRGDMWVVGPRPHSPFAKAGNIIYAEAIQEYALRYRIKPGITGWAQVCGWRGPTDTLEQLSNRVDHDLYYVENWSTFFDLRILFKTVACVFGHNNAF